MHELRPSIGAASHSKPTSVVFVKTQDEMLSKQQRQHLVHDDVLQDASISCPSQCWFQYIRRHQYGQLR